MKSKVIKIVLPIITIFVVIIISGCTITREATLRDVQIKGAVNLPPVHLAEDTRGGRIKVAPHLNYTPSGKINGNVDPTAYVNKSVKNGSSFTADHNLTKLNEVEQSEYSSNGNLTWEIPDVSGGLDFEIFLSGSFSVSGSYNIASGGSFGSIGIALQSVRDNVGIRLDGGLLFNRLSYNAYSKVEERTESIFGSSSETYYFHDIGSFNSTNMYVSLTFNSADKENLFGFLLSMGYFSQTILDYNPGNLDDGYYLLFPPFPLVTENNNTNLKASTGYFNLLPAVFMNLNQYVRITGGVRMNTEIELGGGDVNFWPFFQTEFTF